VLVKSLAANKVRSRKLLFSLIAILICITLVFGTVAALTFMSTPKTSSSPKTTIELQTPLPQGCITADQAIQTAKNYTNQYAQENNRKIVDIKAVFGNSTIYYNDNSSSQSDIPIQKKTYYVWNVTATFQEIFPERTLTDGQSTLECYTSGYFVSIYGYSGQLKTQGQIIIVNQQNLYDNLQFTVQQGKYSLSEGSISAEQFFKMAIPYISQYVIENNRTVTEIEASFGMYSTSLRPVWEITAYFSGSVLEEPNGGCFNPELSHVFGYTVEIWADTGEILSHQEIGIM
jgi:hypothetical protein